MQTEEQARKVVRRGTQLNGIYEIDEPLASGGMGEVFRGHTVQTGDPVAIKLIRADLAEDHAVLALFRREASALYSIHHEAIVRYFVFSIDPVLERPYLAMEYVEGDSLSDILKEGRISFSNIMALKQRVASGLEAAHKRGIIHRDMAPDNIIVPERDFSRARIIDFGIARSLNLGDATVIGSSFAGKYNYVSPEQLGLFNGEVTVRSDIYSLGLILAYASLGRPIDMKGSQLDVIEKRRVVPDLTGVDAELRPLLTHMLQPNPEDRPATMQEVSAWTPQTDDPTIFRPVFKPRPEIDTKLPATVAAIAQVPEDEPKPTRPRWLLPAALAAFIAVAGAGLAFLLTSGEKTTRISSVPDAPTLKPAMSDPVSGAQRKPLAFITSTDLGPCAAAIPVSVTDTSAAIDGYGTDPKSLETFDQQFKQMLGFEADISFRQVGPAQCPALRFVSKAVGRANSPKIELKSASVRRDQVLSGKIFSTMASIQLLIVDDQGQVHNASGALRQIDDGVTFALRFPAAPEGFHPMLLLAVAGANPLAALQIEDTAATAEVFQNASAELDPQPDTAIGLAYVEFQ